VAAGSGLTHRDRGDQLAAAEAGKPALLLLFGCQTQQVGRHHVVVQAESDAAESARGDLFGDDRVVPEVRVATAAVLLRHRHAKEALLAGLQPHAAVDYLVPFPLLVVGRHMAVQERPERLAEQIVLGFEQRALVLDGTAHGGPPVSETCAQRYTNRMVGLPGAAGCLESASWPKSSGLPSGAGSSSSRST